MKKVKRVIFSLIITAGLIFAGSQAADAAGNQDIATMVIKKAYEFATGQECLAEDTDCWDIGLKICEECNLLHNQYIDNLKYGGLRGKSGNVLAKIINVANSISGNPEDIIHSIAWLCVVEKFVFDAIGGKSQNLEMMHTNFEAMFGNFDTINFATPDCSSGELNGFDNPVSECSLGDTIDSPISPNGPIGPRPGPDMRGAAGRGGPGGRVPGGPGIPTILPDSMVGECGKIDPIHFKNSFAADDVSPYLQAHIDAINEENSNKDDGADNGEPPATGGNGGNTDTESPVSVAKIPNGAEITVQVDGDTYFHGGGSGGGSGGSGFGGFGGKDWWVGNVGGYSKQGGFWTGGGIGGTFMPAPHEGSGGEDLLSQCRDIISAFFAGCMGIGSASLKNSGVICTTPHDSLILWSEPPTCSCGDTRASGSGKRGGNGEAPEKPRRGLPGNGANTSATGNMALPCCEMCVVAECFNGCVDCSSGAAKGSPTLDEACSEGMIGEPIYSDLCGAYDPTPTVARTNTIWNKPDRAKKKITKAKPSAVKYEKLHFIENGMGMRGRFSRRKAPLRKANLWITTGLR